MEKSLDQASESPPALKPAPSAARVTRPPQGLAVNQSQELGAADQAVGMAVHQQLESVPGSRLSKRLHPRPVAVLQLPVACAGGACLLRDQFRQIAQRCKDDQACIKAAVAKFSEAAAKAQPKV